MICTESASIPTNHISYKSQEMVRSILKPLESLHDIHYFNYTVSYPDKTGFTLHTNAEFYNSWFTQEFPMCQFSHDSGWYFWEHCSAKGMIDIANMLGIGKGILHLDHHQDKTITIAFGMRTDFVQSEAFLLNNLNLLKGFGAYFEEEANEIIQLANLEKISYSPTMINTKLTQMPKKVHQEPQHWPFGLMQDLSKRECQCYYLLIKGHSMLEISEILSLSPSSINMYIARLKQKLKCETKNDLILFAQRHGVISWAFS